MAQQPRDLATIWNAYPARKTGQITPLPDNKHTSQDGFTLRRGGWASRRATTELTGAHEVSRGSFCA